MLPRKFLKSSFLRLNFVVKIWQKYHAILQYHLPTLIACNIVNLNTATEKPSSMYDVVSQSGEGSFSRLFSRRPFCDCFIRIFYLLDLFGSSDCSIRVSRFFNGIKI